MLPLVGGRERPCCGGACTRGRADPRELGTGSRRTQRARLRGGRRGARERRAGRKAGTAAAGSGDRPGIGGARTVFDLYPCGVSALSRVASRWLRRGRFQPFAAQLLPGSTPSLPLSPWWQTQATGGKGSGRFKRVSSPSRLDRLLAVATAGLHNGSIRL